MVKWIVETAWNFGQILATVMVVKPLVELVSILLKRVEKKHKSSPQSSLARES